MLHTPPCRLPASLASTSATSALSISATSSTPGPCSFNMAQEDVNKGFVANAFVRGHVTKTRWRWVPGSLLCL